MNALLRWRRWPLVPLRAFRTLIPLLVCLSAPCHASPAPRPVRGDFYVATNGNDGWTGRLAEPNIARTDGPFATLTRARDAVREAKRRSRQKDYQVVLRDGRYQLQETLVFGLEDSAPAGGQISYLANPGETPVISSGVPITGWRRLAPEPANLPVAARGKVWVAGVSDGLDRVRTLYDREGRLPRARGGGFTPVVSVQGRGAADEFHFPAGALKDYPDREDAELVIIPSCDYELNILPLASVNERAGIARTTVRASRAIGKVKYFDQTIWPENVLEVLDQPGEWVFHRADRKIYLWPRSEPPGNDIVAPRFTELVRVEGEIDYERPQDRAVTGLTFRGLTFSHAERYPWHGGTGWSLQHSWEMFDRPTAAVRFRGAAGCAVEACRFLASSGTGLRLDLTCERNRVADNEFAHLGAVAILLSGYPPGKRDANQHNEIINNWVHHTGEIYQASPAIMVCQSGHNRIANNLIHNTPYSGIVLSGRDELHVPQMNYGWDEWYEREKYYHARQNKVEHNEIHHVMESMGDGNGIYISGCGKQNHIYQNLIHDCVGPHMGAGIRCDDVQNETIVEGNVIYHLASVQTGISVTGRNHLLNNIIVDVFPSPRAMAPGNIVHGYISVPAAFPYGTSSPAMDITGMRLERNIVLSPRKDYLPVLEHKSFPTGPGDRLKGTKTDHNLYWCPADPLWGAHYLEDQQAKGVERRSQNADPLFVNWEKGDLRLKPGSPARALGFKPVDFSRIGLLPNHPYHRN